VNQRGLNTGLITDEEHRCTELADEVGVAGRESGAEGWRLENY